MPFSVNYIHQPEKMTTEKHPFSSAVTFDVEFSIAQTINTAKKALTTHTIKYINSHFHFMCYVAFLQKVNTQLLQEIAFLVQVKS
jgi:hypothetical protein